MIDERLTEEEWYKKKTNDSTLYGVSWTIIKSWIDDAKRKGFDVTDYIHKQTVKDVIQDTISNKYPQGIILINELFKRLGLWH